MPSNERIHTSRYLKKAIITKLEEAPLAIAYLSQQTASGINAFVTRQKQFRI